MCFSLSQSAGRHVDGHTLYLVHAFHIQAFLNKNTLFWIEARILIRNHPHMQSHNVRRYVIDLSSVFTLLFVCGWLGVFGCMFVSHLELLLWQLEP